MVSHKYLAVLNAERVWCGGKDEVVASRRMHQEDKYTQQSPAESPQKRGSHLGGAETSAVLIQGKRVVGVFSSAELEAALANPRTTSRSNSAAHIPMDLGIEGNTKVLDLGGKGFVCPGFVDAHLHFLDSGRLMFKVNLDGCDSKSAFQASVVRQVKDIKEKLKESSNAESGSSSSSPLIIYGRGWTEAELGLPVGETPTTEWLDGLEGCEEGVALIMKRNCLHSCVVNSLTLQMLEINENTPDPEGGRIERFPGEGNRPNGILREGALKLLHTTGEFAKYKMDTPAKNALALEAAQSTLFQQGVTQCHHMSAIDYDNSEPELRWLMEAEMKGQLKIRAACATRLVEAKEAVKLWQDHHKAQESTTDIPSPGLLSFGMVKCFIDGALGSKTLAMIPSSEYNAQHSKDEGVNNGGQCTTETLSPDLKGLMMLGWPDGIKRQAAYADSQGLQLCFHAIGDAAVRACIEVADYCLAARESGLLTMIDLDDPTPPPVAGGPRPMLRAIEGVHKSSDRRLRVEHCQNVAPVDRAKLHRHGMVASMQPLQLIGDTVDSDCMIGVDRSAEGSYAFRSLVDTGIPVAFGSDWMVCFPSVLKTLYTAVRRMGVTNDEEVPTDRKDATAKPAQRRMQQWNPEQALTPTEALLSSTYWASHAAFLETEVGTLAPGFLADITILAEDPLKALDSLSTVGGCGSGVELEDTAVAFENHCKVMYTIVNGEVQYSSVEG